MGSVVVATGGADVRVDIIGLCIVSTVCGDFRFDGIGILKADVVVEFGKSEVGTVSRYVSFNGFGTVEFDGVVESGQSKVGTVSRDVRFNGFGSAEVDSGDDGVEICNIKHRNDSINLSTLKSKTTTPNSAGPN